MYSAIMVLICIWASVHMLIGHLYIFFCEIFYSNFCSFKKICRMEVNHFFKKVQNLQKSVNWREQERKQGRQAVWENQHVHQGGHNAHDLCTSWPRWLGLPGAGPRVSTAKSCVHLSPGQTGTVGHSMNCVWRTGKRCLESQTCEGFSYTHRRDLVVSEFWKAT